MRKGNYEAVKRLKEKLCVNKWFPRIASQINIFLILRGEMKSNFEAKFSFDF